MGRMIITVVAGSILHFCTPGHGQDAETLYLSLMQAHNIAKTRSYQARLAELGVKQASGRNLESLSGFLPRVTISENYIRSNNPVTVFGSKLGQGVFNQQDFDLQQLNDPDDFNNFITSIKLEQPVFNLDAIYGKSAANLNLRAKKESAQRARETTFLQVSKAYFGLILARENQHAISKAVGLARAYENEAKTAFEQGLINQADFLATRLRSAELEEELIGADYQIANASDALRLIMGLEDGPTIIPTDSLELPRRYEDKTPPEDLTSTRSDLRAIALEAKAAGREMWMQRSGWVPRVNAFAVVEWNAADVFGNDASNYAIGFQLEWNLFDGLGRLGRSRQAASLKETAEVRYRQAELQARLEVRKAQRGVTAAGGRVKVAQSAVLQASESMRIAEARFSQGLLKASDVLEHEVALTGARLRHAKAKYDYNVASNEFDYALGKPSMEWETR